MFVYHLCMYYLWDIFDRNLWKEKYENQIQASAPQLTPLVYTSVKELLSINLQTNWQWRNICDSWATFTAENWDGFVTDKWMSCFVNELVFQYVLKVYEWTFYLMSCRLLSDSAVLQRWQTGLLLTSATCSNPQSHSDFPQQSSL